MIGIAIATGQNSAGLDPAAQAYFAATGITGATQQAAIDNLVKGLKTDGLWSKMKAVYPFVTDNRNLLSYTEDFSNGYWAGPLTISTDSTTAPNGTNTADALIEGNKSNTYYQSNFASLTLSSSNYTLTVYVKKGTRDWVQLSMNNGTTNLFSWFNVNTGSVGTVQVGASASITNSGNGWYRCTMTCAMSISGNIIGFGPAISDGVSTYTGNSSIGIYAWGAQLELGSTATTYQPIATTQQAYIASQFKYNLVNPVDSDAAFRLVFNGGWTHSSNGATPNGTNGYADTKLVPSSVLSLTSGHLSYYSRTNAILNGWMMGAETTPADRMQWVVRTDALGAYYGRYASNTIATTNGTTSLGLSIMNRPNVNNLKLHQNSSIINTTVYAANTLPTIALFLGGNNSSGTGNAFNNAQNAFTSIGDGLTDTEAVNLYTRVQAYQTALSRNV